MIGIIDYGLGNIQSFLNGFRILDVPAIPVKNKFDLQKIDRAILPGVGAFDSAIQRLNDFDLVQDLEDLVLNQSLPILGVCVGLQIMARSSEEGIKKGLAWSINMMFWLMHALNCSNVIDSGEFLNAAMDSANRGSSS